ncbi:hypothetical protein HZS_7010, partial [Henneguya salminicola]
CGLYKLEIGMLVGFVVSAAFIMFRELRPRLHGEYDMENDIATLYVKGAIHFPGAYSISTRLRTLKLYHPSVKEIVLECTNMYETDTSVVEELKEAIEGLRKENIIVTLKHLKKGRVHDLFFGAGLKENVVRGMRTNSCMADIRHEAAHHMVAFHSNPRDLGPTHEVIDEATSESSVEMPENDANYLYT